MRLDHSLKEMPGDKPARQAMNVTDEKAGVSIVFRGRNGETPISSLHSYAKFRFQGYLLPQ